MGILKTQSSLQADNGFLCLDGDYILSVETSSYTFMKSFRLIASITLHFSTRAVQTRPTNRINAILNVLIKSFNPFKTTKIIFYDHTFIIYIKFDVKNV